MLARLSSRGFNQTLLPFAFHTHLRSNLASFLLSPMAASPTPHLPSFSTGSPSPSPSPALPTKCVGTHNGSFHCDEALGCFMIRLTDKFSNAEIVRTRDPQVPTPFWCSFFVFRLVSQKTAAKWKWRTSDFFGFELIEECVFSRAASNSTFKFHISNQNLSIPVIKCLIFV